MEIGRSEKRPPYQLTGGKKNYTTWYMVQRRESRMGRGERKEKYLMGVEQAVEQSGTRYLSFPACCGPLSFSGKMGASRRESCESWEGHFQT